jgi:hypothetical protein
MNGNTPPNKFPQWVDLTPFATEAEKAAALGAAYQTFYETYHMWPTVAVQVSEVVYLGGYGAYSKS